MQFVFNDRKTAQAAAWLLDRHEGRMRFIKLVKLLYLADRQSLVNSGYPITGDRLVSMDYGPVLSRVLNLITGERYPGNEQESVWTQYISAPDDYEVSLLDMPEMDELSAYELGILEDVFEKFGHWDRWELVRYTHTLPEWEDPQGTSIAIDTHVILREAGKSDEEIRATAEQVEAIRAFRSEYAVRQ